MPRTKKQHKLYFDAVYEYLKQFKSDKTVTNLKKGVSNCVSLVSGGVSVRVRVVNKPLDRQRQKDREILLEKEVYEQSGGVYFIVSNDTDLKRVCRCLVKNRLGCLEFDRLD